MSVEAITWALAQPIKHSSAKFVLVVMANCADGRQFLAWPSTAYLSEATGQDRKTVIENIRRLREMGYIEDTGERKGTTGQVIVYRIKSPENGTVEARNLSSEGGTNDTEIGTVKQSRKRNASTDETVPFFPSNSTVFPVKESRFSRQRVPKTGHGTVMEPSLNRQGIIDSSTQARNIQIAMLLRAQQVDATSQHPLVCLEWAGNPKVTDEILGLAVEKAREAKPAPQRIPVNYLKPIVEQLLDPPEPKAKPQGEDWSWKRSDQGIERKGRELGMFARGGESYRDFADRIEAEILKRRGKAA